jgi:hypothetical protein
VATLNLSTGQISDGLVGHWKFDETDGLTAANSAGGSAGELLDFGWANWDVGQVGNALNYDFVGYVFVDDYPKATDALSVSGWVKLGLEPTTDAGAPILRNWGATEGQFNLSYTGVDPSQLQAQVRIGPNTVTAATPAADANPTEWTHVAMTADGARLTLYVNGAVAARTDYIGRFNNPPMPWLAFGSEMLDDGTPDPSGTKLFGATDDVGLWTRALSADEVAAIYEAGLEGNDLSTVEIEIPTEPEIAISLGEGGSAVIDFIGVLLYSPTVDGPYTEVEGAVTPYITTERGFYQASE